MGLTESVISPSCVVSTLAGSSKGFIDDNGSSARFYHPLCVCVDSQDNIVVSDKGNNKIRKISPLGDVSTLAGNKQGYADGSGLNAQFNRPRGVCVDSQDNIVVADHYNHKIRKISTLGVVTTIAGSTQGFSDGIGSNAQFNRPHGVCIDSQGNIVVSDSFNHKIRMISPLGVVSTLAGSTKGYSDGNSFNAQFNWPCGICIDSQDNIVVADCYNHKIRMISPLGVVSTLAGSTQGFLDGNGSNAQFNWPYGVCIDSQGNIVVSDSYNHKIRMISPLGVVSTLAGSTQGKYDGNGPKAKFNCPFDVCVDSQDDIVVADFHNNKIRKISTTDHDKFYIFLNGIVPENCISQLVKFGVNTIDDLKLMDDSLWQKLQIQPPLAEKKIRDKLAYLQANGIIQ